MSNFEIGYCPLDEYTASEEKRIFEDDLAVEGLYTVMFRLKGDGPEEAAKYPSRVSDVIHHNSGFAQVVFTILNADLGPDVHTLGNFTNGYWQAGKSIGLTVGGSYDIEAGFFKQYSDGDGGEQELQDIIKRHTAVAVPRRIGHYTVV